MRVTPLLAGLPILVATPALAQHEGHAMPAPAQSAIATSAQPESSDEMPAMDWPTQLPSGEPARGSMVGMAHSDMEEKVGDQPPPLPPTDHAADQVFDPAVMRNARDQLYREHGGARVSMILLSLGEWQVRDGEDGYRWEGEAWFGGDLNRIVVKSEGEGRRASGVEAAEAQLLYSRAVGPYFDLQAGVRQDLQSGPRRTYATLGFEGLAPYWFATTGSLFLSDQGDLLGRLEGALDLRLTQRWILQPRGEVNLAAQHIPKLGVGSSVSNVELGLRLRYEIRREFAPYVGVSFDRKFGRTSDYARAAGDNATATSLVAGVRGWF